MRLTSFPKLETFEFAGDLTIDPSNMVVPRGQVEIPFLRKVKTSGNPIKIDTLVWLLENCPSLEHLTIRGFHEDSSMSYSPKLPSNSLDSKSFRASVKQLEFRHTFDTDEDPIWLPFFDAAFKSLTHLRIGLYGDQPAAADRFFIHLFEVCLRLKVLDVDNFLQHHPSHLKSLEKANLLPQLTAVRIFK